MSIAVNINLSHLSDRELIRLMRDISQILDEREFQRPKVHCEPIHESPLGCVTKLDMTLDEIIKREMSHTKSQKSHAVEIKIGTRIMNSSQSTEPKTKLTHEDLDRDLEEYFANRPEKCDSEE